MAKSPINWYGGKYYMANDIIDIMPVHKVYIEVFGGAGHLLFKKKPSEIEVYNDIDNGLYEFFNVIRDEEKANKLKTLLELTPHSRKEYYNCKESWRDEGDEIERVRKWYTHLMQSFSGFCVSWSHSKNVSRRGMSQATSKYLGNIEKNIPDAIERLRTVQIESLDCIELIKKYDSEETVFYLDPPYVHDTRKEGSEFVYNHEMDNEQHKKLVDMLLHIKGKAILSGYDHEIYDKLAENGWNKFMLGEYNKRNAKVKEGKGEKGKEYIWINYNIGIKE